MIWFRFGGTPFSLVANESHLAPVEGFHPIVYALPNCTGQAFLLAQTGASVLPRVSIGYPEQTVYVADGRDATPGTPNTYQSESEAAVGPEGVVTLCNNLAVPDRTLGPPVAPLLNLQAQFTPPFSVR